MLDRLAAGRSTPQIAAEPCLASETVRNDVTSILAKLPATDRADVIIRARDAGPGVRRGPTG